MPIYRPRPFIMPIPRSLRPSVTKIQSGKESMTDGQTDGRTPRIYRPPTFGVGVIGVGGLIKHVLIDWLTIFFLTLYHTIVHNYLIINQLTVRCLRLSHGKTSRTSDLRPLPTVLESLSKMYLGGQLVRPESKAEPAPERSHLKVNITEKRSRRSCLIFL